MMLCIYQNAWNFTDQRKNLNMYEFLESSLKGQEILEWNADDAKII